MSAAADGPGDAPVPAAAGYRLVLPPGWVRLPVRRGTEAAVDALLADRFDGLPVDRFGPVRRQVRRQLLAQLDRARDHEAVELYLPVAPRGERAVPASIVVSLLPFDSQVMPEPEQVLAAYGAGTDGARLLLLDGAPAVRTQRVVGPGDGDEVVDVSSVRVDHVVAVPGTSDVWLTFSFSTVGDGDPAGRFTTVLVELYDAVMGTLRWDRA